LIYLSAIQLCEHYERIISELIDERDVCMRECDGLRARMNEQVGCTGPGGEPYLPGGGRRGSSLSRMGQRRTSRMRTNPTDQVVSLSCTHIVYCYVLIFLLLFIVL